MAKLQFLGSKRRNLPFSGVPRGKATSSEGRFALACQISCDFNSETHDFY